MALIDSTKSLKRFFYLFLCGSTLFWIVIESCRNLISRDAIEAVIWGDLLSFGTNKHPPLSGWLASGFYHLFGDHDFGIYLLGQLCIVIGLIYLYKLAKKFLSEEEALCATLVMTPCSYYTYQAFYDNFNCNYISIPLWAMLVYYFYSAVKEDKLSVWLLFGLTAGLAILAKYQVVFLFLPLFIYLLLCARKSFKSSGIYLAALLALVIIAPHFYWLYQNDFFSFSYLFSRTESALAGSNITLVQRFIFPAKFYLDQLVSLLPCFMIYLVLAFKTKGISFRKLDFADKDLIFILLISLLPMITAATIGFFTTSRIVGAWASTMVGFMGLLLCYLFPINLKPKLYPLLCKWVSAAMILWMLAMLIFVGTQTKIDMGYPTHTIMEQIDHIWRKNYGNTPLKYVRGDYKNGFQFLYHPQKPTIILETFGHKNPWIDLNAIKKAGLLIVSFTPKTNQELAAEFSSILPPNFSYKSQRFTYTIKNSFNQQQAGEFYYLIIPPANYNLQLKGHS